MKIYTKTGDKGKTSLYDGVRVGKDSARVESYGTIDELVSYLGISKNYIEDKELYDTIEKIQKKLFVVGSNLATEDPENIKYKIEEEDIIFLEDKIDYYMDIAGHANSFVLPGSGKASAFLHASRTICRRAERRIISLSDMVYVDPLLMKFVNRLSDVIYSFSRYMEEEEIKIDYEKI